MLKRVLSFFSRSKTSLETGLVEFFTKAERRKLSHHHVPKHVAFIPDGNRRWAKKNLSLPECGHEKGASSIVQTTKAAKELGVRVVTFYLFSTENWKRPQKEIDYLMRLLKTTLLEQKEEMISSGIRFRTIGDLSPFSEDILQVIEEVKEATENLEDVDLVFALNYGGRNALVRAMQEILEEDGERIPTVTEEMISAHLDTRFWPEPDLLIRTSGEQRISNFLLWELSYTELYFTPVLWPDFTPMHLLEAFLDYQRRERRMGGE